MYSYSYSWCAEWKCERVWLRNLKYDSTDSNNLAFRSEHREIVDELMSKLKRIEVWKDCQNEFEMHIFDYCGFNSHHLEHCGIYVSWNVIKQRIKPIHKFECDPKLSHQKCNKTV